MNQSQLCFIPENGQLESFNNVERKKYLQKAKIIKHLYIKGAKSNADICNRFDISSPTSMKLINQLMEEGLVRKQGRGKSEGGRKPDLYGLQDKSLFVLGIHMERFKIRMAIFDNNNNSITKIKVIPLDISVPDAIDQLYKHASTLITTSGIATDKIVGIGISMPGLVSSEEGKSFTYFLRKEESATLQQVLEEKFAKPVLILNDAKSACLAEFRFGHAKTKKNILVLSMDGGLGLGIIVDGKMQSGTSGFAGEFGHIPFIEDGLLCHCGKRGCLETVASGMAIARMAKEGVKSGQSSLLNELSEKEINKIEPQMVIEAAHKGDQFAINILSEIGINLGKGIAILIQLFNPELIILQGKIAEAKQYITTPIQQSINTYCMTQLRERTSIALSELGPKASILGSVAAVMENIFTKQIERAKAYAR
jgi:N-acetylglucosamine repressor